MDRPDDAPRESRAVRPFAGYEPAPFGAPPPRAPRGEAPRGRWHPPRTWDLPAVSPALRRAFIAALALHLVTGGALLIRWPHGDAPAGMPGNFHIDVSPEIQSQRALHVAPPVTEAPAEPASPKAEPVIEKPNTKGPIEPRAVIPQTRRPSAQNALLAPGATQSQHGALTAPTSFQLGTGGKGSNSEFAYYLAGVRAKIERSWTPPRGAAGKNALAAKVVFTISRGGQVSAVSVEERSGVSFFDQTCMDAIRRASPFAPLPDGYGYSDMVIHFAFTYAD